MQLAVICAEDAPKITPEDRTREAEGSMFGPYVMRMQQEACAFWPRGTVDAAFYEPVTSAVPTLVMSGELDPVTPPVWGEAITKHLSNAKHVVIPGTGHTAGGTGCGMRIIRSFITKGTTEGLDTSCIENVKRPPFFVTPAGPDPGGRLVTPKPERRAAEGRRRMIRVENLHKRFGEVRAVDGVSFIAADGQVTGLLGPNGAGKTTTLRMLYTLMRSDEGKIFVDDVDAEADPQGARLRLGVLPDQSGLYPRLTAREHIDYFGELQGITGVDLRNRTDHLLKMLDMTAIADRRVAGFSHGERTKTALARAIVHNPKNVLLDEPTNGLDVMSTRAVREIIRRLKSEGHTVLFSSHVMQEVSALCDTIVVIARGKIVAAGSPDDLRAQTGHQNLEDAFVALSGLEPEAAAFMRSTPFAQALVVMRKELKDWSRDRRSIITVLVSSLLAPGIIFFMFNSMASRQRQVEDVSIPVVGASHAPAFVDWLRQQAGVTIVEGPDDAAGRRPHAPRRRRCS